MAEINPLEREAHHGDAYLEANNMLAVVQHHSVRAMNYGVFFCLAMIIMKVARAFNDPTHMDNWVDIIGYATLAKNHIERINNAVSSERTVHSTDPGRSTDGRPIFMDHPERGPNRLLVDERQRDNDGHQEA